MKRRRVGALKLHGTERVIAWITTKGNLRLVIGAALVGIIVCTSVFATWIAPHDPTAGSLQLRLKAPFWINGGLSGSVFGTDQLGRDLFSRMLYGGRLSIFVGLATVAIAGVAGTLMGLYAGFHGGIVDQVVSALVNMQMAFPFLLLAIIIVSVFGPSLTNVIVVLSLWGWVFYARLVRGETLKLVNTEFVQAASAVGASHARIMLRHVLPNVLPSLLVLASFQLAQMIVAESAMSFLGLGVQPPTPTLGGIIASGRDYLSIAWWVSTCAGVVLMLLVLGIGLIGEWLRDALDPRQR